MTDCLWYLQTGVLVIFFVQMILVLFVVALGMLAVFLSSAMGDGSIPTMFVVLGTLWSTFHFSITFLLVAEDELITKSGKVWTGPELWIYLTLFEVALLSLASFCESNFCPGRCPVLILAVELLQVLIVLLYNGEVGRIKNETGEAPSLYQYEFWSF